MTKTTATETITRTKSLTELGEDFAKISDSSDLRLEQCRIVFQAIGNAEGKEAAELKDAFRKEANGFLRNRNEDELTVPAVTNFVNGWKYMVRANVTPTGPVAKASFQLAQQQIAKKEDLFVQPAISEILAGGDPEATFTKYKKALADAKKAKNANKDTAKPNDGTDVDEEVSFDSIIGVLGMITPDNFAKLTDDQKSTLRAALATASAVTA